MIDNKRTPKSPAPKTQGTRLPIKALVTSALLVSMSVVIGQLSMIFANHTLRIGIARIPIVIASMLFGPFAGALAGFIQDIIGVMLIGGGFHPGFTLSSVLVGMIPGMVVWFTRSKLGKKKTFTLFNAAVSMVLIFFLVNLTLDTYWASTILGDAYLVLLPLRATIYGLVAVITTVVILTLSGVLQSFKERTLKL
ncbi:folate family ECF transporter S component [Isachenkonia alkalipeptolytica]|uniref:Folate family ECF transporter S component n=1 Tax=Isachenkonia alkalipeptolytica TaxID=2565777 RepID=A0AA43XJI0_9CLOT|nr:folate family ECF transporter S component [Isachenkonia alkalipeptolytica]NBG88030.1 folate family ECF transporter S component [Isachenkonia alkalipeptolytica]